MTNYGMSTKEEYSYMMKRIKFSLFLLLFLPVLLSGEVIKLIDVPTALTILRGYYDVEVFAYGRGGLQTKIGIGLTDRLMLGILEDVGGALGNGRADWKIPGVFAKINLIYPDKDSMGLSLGYDVLLNGEYGKVYNNQMTDDLVYGFYIVGSKPIILFQGEQYLHFGVRFPILPAAAREKGRNISMFLGLNIIFSPELMLIGEIENFYFNGNRSSEVIYNAGLKYAFNESLSLGLLFQYTKSREINPTDRPSRSISIEYQNIFY